MQERWHTWASMVILVLGGLAGIWLLLTYGIKLLSPFIWAWLLSRLISPVVDRMTKNRLMPRGLAAGILVCIFVGGAVALLTWGARRGMSELGKLMQGLSQADSPLSQTLSRLQEFFVSVSTHIPFLKDHAQDGRYSELCEQIDAWAREGATQILKNMGERVPSVAWGVVGGLPSVLIYTTSLLFSCYYFSADDGKMWQGLTSCLPPVWQGRLERVRQGAGMAAKKYVRAYLLLGLVTFAEMFVGLSLLGVPYAFLIGWGIAVVDFLPLLGTGVVLVPWSILMLISGKTQLGLGLLVLFLVSSLVRQLIEPKLVSRELGLHPLLSLVAVYVGWKLLGVWGMMIAPLMALLAKALLQKTGRW